MSILVPLCFNDMVSAHQRIDCREFSFDLITPKLIFAVILLKMCGTKVGINSTSMDDDLFPDNLRVGPIVFGLLGP